jgi:hypothetical protein
VDAFLVRYGELVGVTLVVLATLALISLWVATRRRVRAVLATKRLGPSDRLNADAIGEIVVLEGIVRDGARVERFARAGEDDVVATTVRFASNDARNEGEIVAQRGRDLGLVVDDQHVRAEGAVVVLSSAAPVKLPEPTAREVSPGGGALDLLEHAVRRGVRVRIKARLARDESGYRGGGLALVGIDAQPIQLMPLEPSAASLARGALTITAIVLPIWLFLGQVLSLSLANDVSRDEQDLPPEDEAPRELPLRWSHRLALLGHRPVEALTVFDRLLARGHVSPALLAMAADAHARRGDCARGIEVLASHGAFALGRAYTAHYDLQPAVLRARAELERADGHVEEALAWIDRNADDALSVSRDDEAPVAGASFRALLLIETGQYAEAAEELETRVRPALARAPDPTAAREFACLEAALTTTAARPAAMPEGDTPACLLLRQELDDAPPATRWDAYVGDLRWLVAAAAYATHPDAAPTHLGPPSSYSSLGVAFHDEWPRWDGLVEAALAATRARSDAQAVSTLCQLERAEAMHHYGRTGEMREASEECASRGDDRAALVALDRGEAVPGSSVADVEAFRASPSLETLRAMTLYPPPREIVFEGENELCVAGCGRYRAEPAADARETREQATDQARESPAEDMPRTREHEERPRVPEETALERAAVAGDARAMRTRMSDGLTLRLAHSHADEVSLWYTHRLRRRGEPRVRLFRLREASYTDLWIARRRGDAEAVRDLEARLDRFEEVLADRRRVVLLEAFWLALEPG